MTKSIRRKLRDKKRKITRQLKPFIGGTAPRGNPPRRPDGISLGDCRWLTALMVRAGLRPLGDYNEGFDD